MRRAASPRRFLDDAVKLQSLPGGDAESVVAIPGSKIVHGEILISCDDASRNSAPDHQDVFLGAGLAQVAVVFLIDAVEFQEAVVVVRKFFDLRNGKRFVRRANSAPNAAAWKSRAQAKSITASHGAPSVTTAP